MEQVTPTPAAVAEGVSTAVSLAPAYSPPRGRVSKFAVNALRDAYIATNPRPVSEDDVRRICVAAY